MIEIDDVSFTYREGERDAVPALRGLTLTLQPGEFVALLGRNGSGKSTLLRLLISVLYPSGGDVRVDGLVSSAANRWSIRERVAVVFQDPDDQIVGTRVLDEVAFGPENLGLAPEEIAHRVGDALEAAGIAPLREALVADLSPGQKQRVALAGALAMQPRYLILDEPASLLSSTDAVRLIGELRRISDDAAMAVLYITHDMREAAMFDRVLVLDGGELVADDPPEAVFAQADLLRAAGLDVPLPARLAERLRAAGVPIVGAPLTPSSLRERIAQVASLSCPS